MRVKIEMKVTGDDGDGCAWFDRERDELEREETRKREMES